MTTNYDDEQRAIDAVTREQRRGTTMQALGWLLIIFDLIPAVWLWVGYREGSLFWLWWVLIEAVIGGVLLIAGRSKRANAAREFAARDRGQSGPKAA